MPLSAPTERETFDSDQSQSFVITFQSDPVSDQTFVIVIVESGRNARRELGKKYEKLLVPNTRGKRKHTKKKKTYLTLFPRERNTIYDIKERAKRSEPTQSRLFSITDSFGFAKVCFMFIHHRRFALVSTLSFLSLSLARAQKEERTRPKNERGKVRTCTQNAGARAHGENRIRYSSTCF